MFGPIFGLRQTFGWSLAPKAMGGSGSGRGI
jgi:hypothetical protein